MDTSLYAFNSDKCVFWTFQARKIQHNDPGGSYYGGSYEDHNTDHWKKPGLRHRYITRFVDYNRRSTKFIASCFRAVAYTARSGVSAFSKISNNNNDDTLMFQFTLAFPSKCNVQYTVNCLRYYAVHVQRVGRVSECVGRARTISGDRRPQMGTITIDLAVRITVLLSSCRNCFGV